MPYFQLTDFSILQSANAVNELDHLLLQHKVRRVTANELSWPPNLIDFTIFGLKS